MRLIDRIIELYGVDFLATFPVAVKAAFPADLAARCIYLRIQNVADYYLKLLLDRPDNTINLVKDVPYLIPPWPLACWEWTIPERDQLSTVHTRALAFTSVREIADDLTGTGSGGPRWVLTSAYFGFGLSGMLLRGFELFFLNSDGSYCGGSQELIAQYWPRPDGWGGNPAPVGGPALYTGDWAYRVSQTVCSHQLPSGRLRDLATYGDSPTNPLLFACSFCHCKNVTLHEVPIPAKQIKNFAQKGKPAFARYYELKIQGAREVIDRAMTGAAHGNLQRALHICRGNFATYTEERPLFGKYVGSYWRPMHTRGTAKAGTVSKDYSVTPPGRGA